MLRGPLHNRGADGSCEACGEPFPCPDSVAVYESVKREFESNAAPRVEPADEPRLIEHARLVEPEPPTVKPLRRGLVRSFSANPVLMGCLVPALLFPVAFFLGLLVMIPFGLSLPFPVTLLRALLTWAPAVLALVVWARWFGRRS